MKQKLSISWGAITRRLPAFVIGGLYFWLASRLAFARQFPLPYDESFHVGLIKLYSTHLSPFLASQPAGADAFGAVARDPSYLYHYLMSFPLRLIELFTASQYAQIWSLRAINIALGALSLWLVYKLARRAGISKFAAYGVSFALAVTPVFYDLAAHVNYDNLMNVLVLVSIHIAWSAVTSLQKGKLPVQNFAVLTAVLLCASLVKYSFLPIFVGVVLSVGAATLYYLGRQTIWRQLRAKPQGVQLWRVAIIGLFVIVSSVLWVQRYGVNMVAYQTPHPQCDMVLTVAQCSSYGPWHRNYQLHQANAAVQPIAAQVASYTKYWARSLNMQVFSLVTISNGAAVFTPDNTLRIVARTILIGAGICAVLAVRYLWRQKSILAMMAVIISGYVLALWLQNFADFRHLGAPVAIQGRYLLTILPLVYCMTAMAYELAAYSVTSQVGALLVPVRAFGSTVALYGYRTASYALLAVVLFRNLTYRAIVGLQDAWRVGIAYRRFVQSP